jgi:hypothetical protein
MYRLVCSNGLVVGETMAGISFRHTNITEDSVLSMLAGLVGEIPMYIDKVKAMKGVTLTHAERLEFASVALDLRFGKEFCPITNENLLFVRRNQDYKEDLWTVFNIVQENLIRGGLWGKNKKNRLMRTRKLSSMNATHKLNQDLWNMVIALFASRLGY